MPELDSQSEAGSSDAGQAHRVHSWWRLGIETLLALVLLWMVTRAFATFPDSASPTVLVAAIAMLALLLAARWVSLVGQIICAWGIAFISGTLLTVLPLGSDPVWVTVAVAMDWLVLSGMLLLAVGLLIFAGSLALLLADLDGRTPGAVLFDVPFAVLVFVVVVTIGGRITSVGFDTIGPRAEPLIQAIRAFERANAHPPSELDELVPTYLPRIPQTGLAGFPNYHYWDGGKNRNWSVWVRKGYFFVPLTYNYRSKKASAGEPYNPNEWHTED